MRLLGRILDAFRVLLGQTESQVVLSKIRREWLSIQLDMDVDFEKINALVARLAKRTKREADRVTSVPTAKNLELVPTDRKTEIRARIRARKTGQHLTPEPPAEETENVVNG